MARGLRGGDAGESGLGWCSAGGRAVGRRASTLAWRGTSQAPVHSSGEIAACVRRRAMNSRRVTGASGDLTRAVSR